ncbi:exopolyphosphatase/guanosine-5'-triphosphate,3'-diphosphate pyrophosphatase [Kribbella orskensis]|uniref:Exopolyphosphatase/guanosine-5'-triphosphate, 3'-diphosphate pyrophosphatase n=2 Tax=Kribbellaceae TaxID=2726069 RepID=A0ABY2BJZ8_9ACTN|nr:exopolyphosphatase/guanosine-5'-triphosphate,3'-diphosphate pyrophosphatase [Kribbella sp. VKM Ac-2500]TCO22939.1 exopolyphosphatase/guanosine-5'-triphosphate,3'-diphosphate pyrophosphatase [Kribbella orskensis]
MEGMRLGVLDVGSNTVHLLVVDAHRGAAPLPAYSHKTELRLAEHLEKDGNIAQSGADGLVAFVKEAAELAEDKGCQTVHAFATSALREAPNGEKVLDRVRKETGIDLDVLTGEDEARLTFLAVRRWFGWSSGRLAVFDIGGGSLEIAAGSDEEPTVAVSVPLGAGRLTRESLTQDPPDKDEVRELRKRIRIEMAAVAGDVLRAGKPQRSVATSKTFRSLARICGAAPSEDGPYVPRSLNRDDLTDRMPKLIKMTAAERGELPGVSAGRSSQLVAGALVADAVMDLFDLTSLEVCPWALREGVILSRLDQLQPR